jgi:hypothetical protein
MRTKIAAVSFVIVLSATNVFAQEATVSGGVVDESGGVLPGVTVVATDVSTGRKYVAVTADRGEYRLGLPAGRYNIQAELPGFATVLVSGIELLVGQNASLPFMLKVAEVQETVSVTSAAPLVDLRSSQVGGNVDRRQMEELPLNGRNWLELSLLVKGITSNAADSKPGVTNDRDFQLNLDGQQITNRKCCSGTFGNPRLSREAIAEYQVVTNLFDITMGRSVGLQVQAITKSGTNNFDGSLFGYFRDDRFNSEDFYTDRVLPYSNQQVGGSFGGPIKRNKTHFFGSYEYEREPNTIVINPSAIPNQSFSNPTKLTLSNYFGRVDHELNARGHFSVRFFTYKRRDPSEGVSSNTYPTRGAFAERESISTSGTWAQVINNAATQEFKAGFFRYGYSSEVRDRVPETPEYNFPGLSVGAPWNYPVESYNPSWNIGYNLMLHKGSHDLKIGGEFRPGTDHGVWRARARGRMFFRSLPADMGRRFPLDAWTDSSKWDLSGLDPLALRFDISYARNDDYSTRAPRPTWAAWIGDTWQATNRLTLTLGVRYDLAWGDLAAPLVQPTDLVINNGKFSENVGFRTNLRDVNNVAARVGFAWDPRGSRDFVIRGGSGLFHGQMAGVHVVEMQLRNGQRVIEMSIANDGRPGWVQDPTRGVTADDVLSGRVAVPPQALAIIAHDFQMPYSWQSVIGFQKQLSNTIGVDADVVYMRGYNEDTMRDANLFYDPATGWPKNPTQFGRPSRDYGPITVRESKGRSEYLATPVSLTKRYSKNFQASATYTLMFFKRDNASGDSGWGGIANNPFDRDSEWGRAGDFQRHTFRANAVWNLPLDLMLGGVFQFGSGNYSSLNSGVDPLGLGTSRTRRDFTLVPRNSWKDDPYQTFDLRISKQFALAGDVKLTGSAEVFNILNYDRYLYNLIEGAATFGERRASGADPRSWQLGFKLVF